MNKENVEIRVRVKGMELEFDSKFIYEVVRRWRPMCG